MKYAASHIARISLLAFLLNVLLPFYATYAVPPVTPEHQTELPSVFGGKILLCTVEGFKWVDRSELQHPENLPAPHPNYQCALCFVAAKGGKNTLCTSTLDSTYQRDASASSPYFISPDTLNYFDAAQRYQSRAPPVRL